MKINQKYFFIPLIQAFLAYALVYISLYVINNPDKYNYFLIFNSSEIFSYNIEPAVYFFSTFSRFLTSLFGGDPLFYFYFQYIFIMQVFLYFAFLNYFNKSIIISFLMQFFWLITYGLMHGLIQIRFGLASCIVFYIFSVFYVNYESIKKTIFTYAPTATLAFFSHYSSILSLLVLLFIWIKKFFYDAESYKIIHLFFLFSLVLFKFGAIFNFLPEFLLIRLSTYIDSTDYEPVSLLVSLMSFLCYVFLVITPKIQSNKLNSLRVYGALGFIPYFVVPEMEILVRLGIPFQYLLLPYLFLSFSYKRLVLLSTLPLTAFFIYKVYSSFNALLGYLN
ncbi:EpsG family protein [Acinetobacter ursingii]|uniref:EpsG family protein n=1 Tax=Acinetobacter ursingii TaxID=108980 RepID=UPI0005C9AFDF|nr:EpsG family protein [Acinetobacter ursingii]